MENLIHMLKYLLKYKKKISDFNDLAFCLNRLKRLTLVSSVFCTPHIAESAATNHVVKKNFHLM